MNSKSSPILVRRSRELAAQGQSTRKIAAQLHAERGVSIAHTTIAAWIGAKPRSTAARAPRKPQDASMNPNDARAVDDDDDAQASRARVARAAHALLRLDDATLGTVVCLILATLPDDVSAFLPEASLSSHSDH